MDSVPAADEFVTLGILHDRYRLAADDLIAFQARQRAVLEEEARLAAELLAVQQNYIDAQLRLIAASADAMENVPAQIQRAIVGMLEGAMA